MLRVTDELQHRPKNLILLNNREMKSVTQNFEFVLRRPFPSENSTGRLRFFLSLFFICNTNLFFITGFTLLKTNDILKFNIITFFQKTLDFTGEVMEYPTPRVAAADYVQKHLKTINIDQIDGLPYSSREKALMRFHAETYLKKFNSILNRAAKHGLIKSKEKAS